MDKSVRAGHAWHLFEVREFGDDKETVFLPAWIGSPEGDHVGGRVFYERHQCVIAVELMEHAYSKGFDAGLQQVWEFTGGQDRSKRGYW